MANSRFYSNTAQETTLSGSISAGATTITVGATTGFPGSFPYTLALDYGAATEELVSVTAAAGANLTVTRAYGGTSAQSHSLGAVVRHVYDSTDATDFRTHEAATAAVHGVTGTLVGTSDTQTLANKTLTSPTITSPAVAGGALSGTFTGTPTFSGAVVLSGTPSISNGAALSGTFTGTPTFSGAVVLSGTPSISAGAALSGTFTGNPTLSGTVALTGAMNATGAAVGTDMVTTAVSGDTQKRLIINAGGGLDWGSGSATVDTNLYRGGANTLQTDSSFTAGGSLTATGTVLGSNLTVFSAYTPTWSGLTSAGTGFSSTGRYCRAGNMVFVSAQLTAGSSPSLGTGTITVSLPVTASSTPTGSFGWQGIGRHNPNNGSTYKVLIPEIDPGATVATVYGLRQSDAGWTTPGTAGFVWVAGSSMRVEFWYEV